MSKKEKQFYCKVGQAVCNVVKGIKDLTMIMIVLATSSYMTFEVLLKLCQ